MLTTGVDAGAAFTGTAGNDIFTAGDVSVGGAATATWTTGDQIDGAGGTNDVFNVVSAKAISVPTAATVKNFETANLTSGETVSVDTTSWTGLTALNSTSKGGATLTAAATTAITAADTGVTGGNTVINGGSSVAVTVNEQVNGKITIGNLAAATGTVAVTSSGNYTDGGNVLLGAIKVTGGSTISVSQTSGITAAEAAAAKTDTTNSTVTQSAVTVVGNAATTAVSVSQDKLVAEVAGDTTGKGVIGVGNGKVTVTDVNAESLTVAGTIKTVSLNGFAFTSTIDSSALETINLSGTGTNLTVTNGKLTTPIVTTQALNVNDLNATGTVALDNDVTTLNLNSSTATSTINRLKADGAKALNISGDAKVVLSGHTLGALTDVVVTNTAGVTLVESLATGVTFTGGAGDDAVVLGATTKAITMGAGNDKVTSAGLVGTGGSVNAGDGIDTIVMTTVQAAVADGDATFNSKFTGFEVLELSDALTASATLNLTGINNVSTVVLTAGGADAATSILSNLVSGGTVKQTGDGTGVVVQVKDATFNAADVLNFDMSKATALAAGSLKADGVETLNITAADANTTTTSAAVKHTVTLDLVDATTVNVSGNNGLTITNTTSGTKITTFDASGVVANSTATVIDTAANLAVTFVSGNSTTTANVSITGGAGDDVLTGNAAKDTIVGGAGNDTIDGKAGVDTLTGGAGVDTFVIGAGEAGITGAEKITDFSIALGGDKLDLATTTLIANVTAANVTGAVGGAVDVTATVKDGLITLGGADAGLVNTVGHIKAIFELLNDVPATAAEVGAIVLNGQTYVLTDAAGSDSVNDIIQLAGVTTATGLSTVDAAGSIWIA